MTVYLHNSNKYGTIQYVYVWHYKEKWEMEYVSEKYDIEQRGKKFKCQYLGH